MTVFHISAECYPIAKVGGLADVVGALPKYQNKLDADCSVIMPFYNNTFTANQAFKPIYESVLKMGHHNIPFKILTLEENLLGFDLFLVDIPPLLFHNYVYSYDDTERFLAFQIATLDWIMQNLELPDIIHCHDHHTALIPFMMSNSYRYKTLRKIPSVLTIHNGQYQGWFSHNKVYLIPDFDFSKAGLLDWNDMINPLAAGIKCAWKVTTVSPNYMEELKHSANGLEQLLRDESNKCVGILNGIDTAIWNPKTDPYLIKNYTTTSVISGKKANKAWLCKTYKINPELPMLAFIGRLVGEKGADLLPTIFGNVLEHQNVSIVMLGSGNSTTEHHLDQLKYHFHGKYGVHIGYDEKLSHILYAGADLLFMPSRVEPCGLNQLYALRYGTVPIVNTVGGLKDTVIDIDEPDGFGIRFYGLTLDNAAHAIYRGLTLYNDTKNFKTNRLNIMKIDHSWQVSAKTYLNLYNSLKS